MWMQIGGQARTGGPLGVSWSSWQVERFHRAARSKAQLHCHRLKQSTWHWFKQPRKVSGCNDCSKNLDEKWRMSSKSSKTIRELLHSPTILHTTHVPNTSTFSTTSSVNVWKL